MSAILRTGRLGGRRDKSQTGKRDLTHFNQSISMNGNHRSNWSVFGEPIHSSLHTQGGLVIANAITKKNNTLKKQSTGDIRKKFCHNNDE